MSDGNGHDDEKRGGAETDVALQEHVFKGLSDHDKLDRLLALYSGLASQLDTSKRDLLNHELEADAEVKKLHRKLDYQGTCLKLIMMTMGVEIPPEPKPESEPPSKPS